MSENWQWCNAPLIRGCACLTRVNFWAGSGRYCASWATAEPQSAGLGQAPGLRAGPRAALAARVHLNAPNTRYCVPGTSWLLLYHLNKPELVCNVLITRHSNFGLDLKPTKPILNPGVVSRSDEQTYKILFLSSDTNTEAVKVNYWPLSCKWSEHHWLRFLGRDNDFLYWRPSFRRSLAARAPQAAAACAG